MEPMGDAIKRWREANPEKYRAQKARWRARHPERKRGSEDTHKRARAKWAAANPEKALASRVASQRRHMSKRNEQAKAARRTADGKRREKAYRLRANYGLTHEQYDAMLSAQGGVCAICQKPETRVIRGVLMPLPVDHDHVTGKVRALLCHRCNATIGFMDENPDRLRRMASYIEAHSSRRAEDGGA